jgi:ADP-ribosylglycohydrolase
MVSDDTEHTCIVAQSLITANGDLSAFQESLAWRLRLWLLGIPAGIGIATLRSTIRLWCGVSPERSGVFSAGNGPAMRAAILGVSVRQRQVLHEWVRVSSQLTHADPKAHFGALAVALAAQMAAQRGNLSPNEFLAEIKECLNNDANDLLDLVAAAVSSVSRGEPTEQFADSLGLTNGVSGYIYHTVPVALHACLAHSQDFRSAVMSVVRCGGDTDSTAAIVGGIVGASVGRAGIPKEWLTTLVEWPRTVSWMERLGSQLASTVTSDSRVCPIRQPALGVFFRNLFFLVIVFYHGFRRLAPPY